MGCDLNVKGEASVPDYSTCEVGDFILKDGTILSKDKTPTSGTVAAVIVRAAEGEIPALGVGIVHSTGGLKWCIKDAEGYKNIEALQIANHPEGDGLSKLKEACSDARTSLEKYPAWEYCSTYGSKNGFSSSIASGWYLPTQRELKTISTNERIVKASLSNAGNTTFYNSYYFSCTQNPEPSQSYCAESYFLASGSPTTRDKNEADRAVCAVRVFK